MHPTSTLDAEMRRRVAKACIPETNWGIWRWEPERSSAHKVALFRACAQLIKTKIGVVVDVMKALALLERFNDALATNDVPEIEKLVFELLGDV